MAMAHAALYADTAQSPEQQAATLRALELVPYARRQTELPLAFAEPES